MPHGTIGIRIARAHGSYRIAESAGASIRAAWTCLANFEQTAAIAAIAIGCIVVIACFAHFEHAIATTGNHAEIGICREFAHRCSSWTIRIFIANANCIDCGARTARTCRRCRASFAEFEQTCAGATIIAHRIAVVATFIQFENVIATTRIDAGIRIRAGIAKLYAWTIDVFITRADHCIAKTAGANGPRGAGLSEFFEALGIAAVTIVQIAVIATFVRPLAAIATTHGHALIWRETNVARETPRAICVFITLAQISCRIAETAGAYIIHACTRLAYFS